MLLQNLRAPGGALIDLRIESRAIAAIEPAGSQIGEEEGIDCGGRLLYPGFVDAHAHIDKSLLGLGWYRNDVGPSIEEMISNERRLRVEQGIDSHKQSSTVARRMIAAGTTHVRTFVDIDTDIGFPVWKGCCAPARSWRTRSISRSARFPRAGC